MTTQETNVGPHVQPVPLKPIDGVEPIYLLNLNVILGVCFALLASRGYQIWDTPAGGPIDLIFVWASVVVLGFLFVTHIEYYWFLRVIVRTTIVVDVFAPLLLGAIQAISIMFLPDLAYGRPAQKWWWIAQAAYSLLGMALIYNWWVFRDNVEKELRRKKKVERGLILSGVMCIVVAVIFLMGGLYPHVMGTYLPHPREVFLAIVLLVFTVVVAVVQKIVTELDRTRV